MLDSSIIILKGDFSQDRVIQFKQILGQSYTGVLSACAVGKDASFILAFTKPDMIQRSMISSNSKLGNDTSYIDSYIGQFTFSDEKNEFIMENPKCSFTLKKETISQVLELSPGKILVVTRHNLMVFHNWKFARVYEFDDNRHKEKEP